MSNLYLEMQQCWTELEDVMSKISHLEEELYDLISSADIVPEGACVIIEEGTIVVVGDGGTRLLDIEEKVLKFLKEA